MNIIQSIILGILEGLTEFLPVSSTGHLVVASSFMGIEKEDFTKFFEIVIQLGAILAVVVLYWKKFFDRGRLGFYIKLFFGVLPALILGYLLASRIELLLESPLVVGAMFLLGGIILLFVDNWFGVPQVEDEGKLDNFRSLRIGFWQCLALIPGVSRSAATIIGGMQQKLTRSFAAEFSFFLAVPTMFAATGYEFLKAWRTTPGLLKDSHDLLLLVLGFLVAFLVAMVAVKAFITYLQRHSFRAFGVYRILAGILILVLFYLHKL